MATAEYRLKMSSYATRASNALGIPKEVIIQQWALESGNGTSNHARNYNNHAGIKVPTQRKFYGYKRAGTPFAGYNTLDDFTNDYISNMSISAYANVRAVGKTGDVVGTIKALGASAWDAGHYNSGGGFGSSLLNALGVTSPGSAATSAPLTAADKKEIERKASMGLALTNPSQAAQDYYNSVKKPGAVCPTCHRPL